MKRVILASAIAFSNAKVAVADNSKVLAHVDKELSDLSASSLNKRAFSSPAAAFARSYGHYQFNKRSMNRADYEKVMKSTITQLKNNLNLLEQKTKGLPDEYVAGLISRLGATSRRTMGRLCRSGEVESRMCKLIDMTLDDNMDKRSFYDDISQIPGRFFIKRSLGEFNPRFHDEDMFMKRFDPALPQDIIFTDKRSGDAKDNYYMNYNTFPGGDSINWGSLPGFGAKSAFNMPNKRSIDAEMYGPLVNNRNNEYADLFGNLLASYGSGKSKSTVGSSLL